MLHMDHRSLRLVVVADQIDQFVSIWHAYRAPLGACAVVVVLLLLLRACTTTPYATPPAMSPGSEEKTAWLSEPESNLRAPKRDVRDTPDTVKSLQALPRRVGPRIVAGQKPAKPSALRADSLSDSITQPVIFFYSLTGTTERHARTIASRTKSDAGSDASVAEPLVFNLASIELDDYFISGPKTTTLSALVKYFYILVIPSYDIDTFNDTFLAHLDETHNDFRIDTAPLASLLGYAVFGIGDKEGWPTEQDGFCKQAVEADRWMAKLTGRKRAYPLGVADVKSVGFDAMLAEWANGVLCTFQDAVNLGTLGEGVPGSGDAYESENEEAEADEFPASNRRKRQKTAPVTDLEDAVAASPESTKFPFAINFTTSAPSSSQPAPPKQMVPFTSPTYTALTKQGYTIIGSHSGVKICRWTKSALRGRGSCYKNSFYGIKSHLCMETTPSLSCSNKCVFCWRHGTNPVSTTWRWEVDPPELIFAGAKEGHYKKINMLRGVPGVRAERFEEAMRIRHCALSLVGEPIFYPRINEFVDLLHGERISSFLVCNAQHPEQLASLKRVTQLYVSIDASNRESLRRIDRPLHRDFWERFQKCLDILREKRFVQRTVFRLTLVKGFNVEDEVEGYAELVQKGLPGFVEVKGVTYCGTSSSAGAGLTMQNVPFYGEVVAFVEALERALARRGLGYGIAAEHAHSCCVLIASKRFLTEGRWNTVIDYERFYDLLEAGGEFGPEDYCSPTPEWALWGNGGFDPADERVDRKGRPKVVEGK